MTTSQTKGLSTIGQIAVTVKNLDTAVAFYRDRLGMALQFQVPGMAFFDCDGVRLMLTLPESPEFDHASSIIYFKVSDIAAQHAAMTDQDVKFVAAPHLTADMGSYELWMAFFNDPDGNILALMSEVPK